MQNYLVVSALVKNSSEIIRKFSKLSKSSGCNVIDSRYKVLGNELSLMVFLGGSWDAVAKIENQIAIFAEEHQFKVITERTTVDKLQGEAMPYAIDVVGLDQPGVIFSITDFMSQNELLIQDMSSNTYEASLTGAKMFSLNMVVNIHSDSSIAAIRSDFIEFCDHLNLDAIMEPVK